MADVSYSDGLDPPSVWDYMVVGFPSSKNRANPAHQTVDARAYSYRSDSISDESYINFQINPSTHVALPLDLGKGFDTQDRKVAFPGPHGMSGSPIWLIYDDAENARSMFPVVGVAIEYRKSEQILVATDIAFLLDLIK